MYESNCPLELDNLSKQHLLSGLAPVSFFLWPFLALLAHNSIPNPGIWIKVEPVDTMHGFSLPSERETQDSPQQPQFNSRSCHDNPLTLVCRCGRFRITHCTDPSPIPSWSWRDTPSGLASSHGIPPHATYYSQPVSLFFSPTTQTFFKHLNVF